MHISSIIFSYGFASLKGQITPTMGPSLMQSKPDLAIKYQTYYKNKLPKSINPEGYGKILVKYNNLFVISLSKNISIHLYLEKEGEGSSQHQINRIEYIKNGNILFTWKDKIRVANF